MQYYIALEKNKSKSGYMQSVAQTKKEFSDACEYIGNSSLHPQLDLGAACLELAYDTLTLDQFVGM